MRISLTVGAGLAALAATTTFGLAAFATPAKADQVELVVQYTQSQIFGGVFDALKEEFEAQHPDVTVTFRGAHNTYSDNVQALLREATVGDMPHINYLGLSYLPVSAIAGTNHQTAFDLADGPANIVSLDDPVYGVIFLGTDSAIVHQHAFESSAEHITYEPH